MKKLNLKKSMTICFHKTTLKKRYLFIVLLVFCAIEISAQDVIVKKDGSTILAKVLEVNETSIKYKKFKNLQGPTYTISISELQAINYENGEKDSFSNDDKVNTQSSSTQSVKYINKPADKRNAEILSLYKKNYLFTDKLKEKKIISKHYFLIFGIKSSSIMSNEDIEMKIVRGDKCDKRSQKEYNGNGPYYYINITNKTNNTVYIDKGNCFKVFNDGLSLSYFDNTEQTTINNGGGSGLSLGLGGVASAMGIGGVAGQIASGISVGGGNTHSVSKSYSQQRIIAIPPHASKNLREEKWVKSKEANLFDNAEYTNIEKAESFIYDYWEKTFDMKLKKGLLNRGEVLTYNENNSPWKREYILTYSTDEDFRTYSTIKAELYLYKIIGSSFYQVLNNACEFNKYFENIDDYMIIGIYQTSKDD